MAALDDAGRLVADIVTNAGRSVLNYQFPDEFEYYLFAVELVDSQGRQVDMLVFPVLPENIQLTKPALTNVKKTSGGVVVLSTPTFTPNDITIQGTFGRKLRVVSRGNVVNVGAAFQSSLKSRLSQRGESLRTLANEFSPTVKTGFGVTKLLENLFLKYNQQSDTGPLKMFVYNRTFSDDFLVEPLMFEAAQSKEQNMIWYYTMRFKTLAPASAIRGTSYKSDLRGLMTIDNLQKGIDKVGDFAKSQARLTNNLLLDQTNGSSIAAAIAGTSLAR